jgi:hypothetical protein
LSIESAVLRAGRGPLWRGVVLGVVFVLAAWALFVMGLLSSFDERTGATEWRERWAYWSLGAVSLIGSGGAAAYLTGRRWLSLLPVVPLATLGAGALAAAAT